MLQISSSSSEGIDFSCLNQFMPKHEEHQETFCTLVKGSIKKYETCLFPFLLWYVLLQKQPPKLEDLKGTQLRLHQVWGNLRILLFLKISQTCWIILDSSFFPATDSGPDSFTETLLSVPGSCQAPGKSQMAPVTALQDHSRIALLILSVKHLFHLKPSNYLYIMTRHTRQRKTPLYVPRQPSKCLKHILPCCI